jgi:hypothetical protein
MDKCYITGYVYFIQAGEDLVVKIGSTIAPLEKRLQALQTANHKKLKILGAIDLKKSNGYDDLNRIDFSVIAKQREAEIQSMFAENRIQGEWFDLTDELSSFIGEFSNI